MKRRPIKWFFKYQNRFLPSVLAIILQLLMRSKNEGSTFYLVFESELRELYPKRHFQIDYLLLGLIGTPLVLLQAVPDLIYPAPNFQLYRYLVNRNQRLIVMDSYGIDLQTVIAKHAATFRERYGGLLELYANRVFRIELPNVYISEYLLELINTELYPELANWQQKEDEELFAFVALMDIDGILSYTNSFTQRPVDLLRPHQYEPPYTIIRQIGAAEWVRLGHYETEMVEQGYGQALNVQSFGGIVFSQAEIETFPHSEAKTLSFFFWDKKSPGFKLGLKPVFSIIQSDTLECFNLVWLNPTLIELLELIVAITEKGLVAIDRNKEVVLKMRTWTSEYLGNGDRSRLSEQISALQGTDLIVRKDYFDKMLTLYSATPSYRIFTTGDVHSVR